MEFLIDGTGASRELMSSNKFSRMNGPITVNTDYDPLA
jgi:hypothetical protein